jgi:hypothetical protein
MGTQTDMVDNLYDKENKELGIAKSIERSYKNLSYVRDVIWATSLRYKKYGEGAFTVNKKLANAATQIHFAIFHMCEFLYRETRNLKEYRSATPMSLIDDVESRNNAGMLMGRPLVDLLQLWEDTTASCRGGLRLAQKNLQNHKSMYAAENFVKSARLIRKELAEAVTIDKRNHALQG